MDQQAKYFGYWGKAKPESSQALPWHQLAYHSLDVAAVGQEYLRRNPRLGDFLSAALGIKREHIEQWCAFWLALHDLGKFSEAFQSQRPDLFKALRGRAPDPAKPYCERHDTLGFLFWSKVLADRVVDEGWFGERSTLLLSACDAWARAVTGHHGQPPKDVQAAWQAHFHSEDDAAAIREFVDTLRRKFLSQDVAEAVEAVEPEDFEDASSALSWWIAGLAVLADWLGSNTRYFPYETEAMSLDTYWERACTQARHALDEAGVGPATVRGGLTFSELFPAIHSPSPLQQWAIDTPLSAGPQIHLLEDVTGAGKTEAAIMLAYRLMAQGEVDGFFVGLPTMATANAMYERVAEVYWRLFEGDASLALAHGRRNLVEVFASSVLPQDTEESDPSQSDETASARCTAWLADHNKRALLAPAGVGTIDQALLGVLHSKHQSLRLLGLFRKVLIVDEVHACDIYMQKVLEVLLEFHARAGGSVILLSATVPQHMRQALLDAFARGCNQRSVPECASNAYPLVTTWAAAKAAELAERAVATREAVRRCLAVVLEDREDAIVQQLVDAARADGCACWIRNTVADALAGYERLKQELPEAPITLFHARFALQDRLRIEQEILHAFGKNSRPEQRAGRVVIATQVAEQSLDADWDFLVSDLAPIDRLIQRAGRMHRHPRDAAGRRLHDEGAADGRAPPGLLVYAPSWEDDPKADWFEQVFPRAAMVYPHHGHLWLTARALRGGQIAMPEDARELIEAVFDPEAEMPSGLVDNAVKAESEGYASKSVARQNVLKFPSGYRREGFDWWSEATTPSRLGEPTTTVVLARWEDGQLLPWAEGNFPERHAWAYSSLSVAERMIALTPKPEGQALAQALDAVQEGLPGKGRWSVVLVLQESDGMWQGEAVGRIAGGRDRDTTLQYDSAAGLLPLASGDREEKGA